VACLWVLLLSFSLVGCSGPVTGAPAAVAAAAPGPAGETATAPPRAEPVRLWQDASIFVLLGGLIGSARKRVFVEMYELGRPDLVRAMVGAQARGVEVRVITDPTVNASRRSSAQLASAGVSERAYPVDDALHQIDHVKLLIADDEAVVGGMNWGAHSDRNHDYVLETKVGVEISRLVDIFQQDWALAGGRPSPLTAAAGEIAQTAPGEEIRSMLESALGGSARVALVEIFTLTDPKVIRALVAAHRRGVDVRVVMDPNQPYNLHSYDMLAAGGVPARWYPVPKGALLHAKIGLFDGELVLGSANWTRSGLGVNHELDIATRDPGAVADYTSRFTADWARSAA
jgi:phosphatidylserine/phosphatidylglycerophosphate/cardiolipin synthase-like enzyme